MNDSIIYLPNDSCLICESRHQKILGSRGNQEYLNAPKSELHYKTNVVQCKKCSFIYCNPTILVAEELEKLHYSNSKSYIDSESNTPGKPYIEGLKAISKFVMKGKLLDIGAGKGEFLQHAKKNGFAVSGIEPSSEFCNYALEKFGISIFCGNVIDYKKDSTFSQNYDYITFFHVLEHVKNPKELLIEIVSLFSKSGICYIEVPNADSTLLKFADFIFRLMGRNWSARLSPVHPPFHSIGYTRKSLERLIENSGYEIIDVWTFTGKNRGHQIRNRFGSIKRLTRNVVVKTIGIFPNRELIGALIRPKNC